MGGTVTVARAHRPAIHGHKARPRRIGVFQGIIVRIGIRMRIALLLQGVGLEEAGQERVVFAGVQVDEARLVVVFLGGVAFAGAVEVNADRGVGAVLKAAPAGGVVAVAVGDAAGFVGQGVDRAQVVGVEVAGGGRAVAEFAESRWKYSAFEIQVP